MRFTVSTLLCVVIAGAGIVKALDIGRHGPRQPENRGYELFPRYQNSSIATVTSSLTSDSVTNGLSSDIAPATSADDIYDSLSTPKSSSVEESTSSSPKSSSVEESTLTESVSMILSTAGTGSYRSYPGSSPPQTSTVHIPEPGLDKTSNIYSLNKTSSGFQHSEQIPTFVTSKPTGYSDSLSSLPNTSSTEEASCFTTPGTVTYTAIGYATTIRRTVTITTQTFYVSQNSSTQPPWQSQPTPSPNFHNTTKELDISPVSETTSETPEPSSKWGTYSLKQLFRRAVSTSHTTAAPKPVKYIQKRSIVEVTRVWTGIGPPPLDKYNTYNTNIPSSAWPTAPPVTLSLDSTTGIFQLPPEPPTHTESLPVETGGCVVQDVATTTIKGNETLYQTVTNAIGFTVTGSPMPTLTQTPDFDFGCSDCEPDSGSAVPPPGVKGTPPSFSTITKTFGSTTTIVTVGRPAITPPVDIEDHATTRTYWETPEVAPPLQKPTGKDTRIKDETDVVDNAPKPPPPKPAKPPPPKPGPQPNSGDSKSGKPFPNSNNNPAPHGDAPNPGEINSSDTDQDGSPDSLDLDTDNDGIVDLHDNDIDGDNIPNKDDKDWNKSDSTDSNGDGKPDSKPDAIPAPKPAGSNSNSGDKNPVEMDPIGPGIIKTPGTAPSDDSGNPSKSGQRLAQPPPNAPGSGNQGGEPGSNAKQGGLAPAKDTDNDGVADYKDGDVDGDDITNENDPDWVYVPPPKQPETAPGAKTPGSTPNGENVQHGKPEDNSVDAGGTVQPGASIPESQALNNPAHGKTGTDGNGASDINSSDVGGDGISNGKTGTDGNGASNINSSDVGGDGTSNGKADGNGASDINSPDIVDGDGTSNGKTDGNGASGINSPDVGGGGTSNGKNSDGSPSNSIDSDLDGIADSNDPDADANGDGVVNALDPNWKPKVPAGSAKSPTATSTDGKPKFAPGASYFDPARLTDQDLDGIPDLKDPDIDGDGIRNYVDPSFRLEDQIDTNKNGIADSKDPDADIDGNGIANHIDPHYNPLLHVDSSSDGTPDATDPTADADGDGLVNSADPDWHPGVPHTEVDTDGDGVVNHNDDDLDGDGIANADDDDVDGDGKPNKVDTDIDGDGISNKFDTDLDGDRVANAKDDDVDNDGVKNADDLDIDGDGVRNSADVDIDGDGIVNGKDSDVDGDGVKNGNDDDVDGDGVKNADDLDIDGDGIANAVDTDIDGDGIRNGKDDDVDGDGLKNDDDADIDADGVKNENDKDADGDGVEDGTDKAGSKLVKGQETDTDTVEENPNGKEEEAEEDVAVGSFGGISFVATIASVGSALLTLF